MAQEDLLEAIREQLGDALGVFGAQARELGAHVVVGQHLDRPYIAMGFIEGQSFKDALKDDVMPFKDRVSILLGSNGAFTSGRGDADHALEAGPRRERSEGQRGQVELLRQTPTGRRDRRHLAGQDRDSGMAEAAPSILPGNQAGGGLPANRKGSRHPGADEAAPAAFG